MTQDLYAQLGISRSAATQEIIEAYRAAVARLGRRLKALREQGGDTAPLDLARLQLDEARQVLTDPQRRRRYDALLAWQEGAAQEHTEEGLWKHAAGALIHPAVAEAAELLSVATQLHIGSLPGAPTQAPPPVPVVMRDEVEAETVADRPTLMPETETSVEAGRVSPLSMPRPSVVSLPSRPVAVPDPEAGPPLKVVDGNSSPVLMMPAERKALDPRVVQELVDMHGLSGSLLRAVRERRGLSIQEVADTTRISVRYLESLEADAYSSLPSATFVRGYVREVAKLLGLDADEVVSGYMRRFAAT